MNTILRRLTNPTIKVLGRNLVQKRFKTGLGDPVDMATGIEKRYLLAQLAGNENPFCMVMLKRGPATKCEPQEIPSAFEKRMIGCVCEPDSCTINYMWLTKDCPKRCECGYWFKLVSVTPL